MVETIKAYLKYIIPGILVIALAGGIWWSIHHYGETRYNDGVAAQVAAQAEANAEARRANEAEKTRLEREHASEMAVAVADADAARDSVNRLQRQLDQIRRLARNYTGAVGAGETGSSTAILLTNVLEKSVERNRDLAEYADRSRLAGQLCERQYDSLKGRVKELISRRQGATVKHASGD